jgi:hypothetical protein
MKINVGSADRIFRFALGIFIIALGIIFKSWFGLIGLLPIITAAMKWCPAYLPFRFSTAKKSGAE